MKKYLFNRIPFVAIALTAFHLTACNDNSYDGIENSGEVKILTFTAGAKQEVLDEAGSTISLTFKSGTDLTKVTPSFTLSEGAQIKSPKDPNGPIDFSRTVTYTVINGNLYHDYKVVSQQVGDATYFEQFNIGIYKGSIDNKERKITIRLPLGSDVTALVPSYVLSTGAELVSPLGSTQNFTHPVSYQIKYLDETFGYEVTVELVDFRKMAFLGTPATAGDIKNMDDKTAYEWFVANFPIAEYVSFKDIKAGKELNDYAVIWYHYDSYDKGGDPVIHADANDPKVIEALNNYLAQGGGLFLSSAGLTLGNVLNIAKEKGMWNNAWGYDRTEPFATGDDWGLCIKGHENHPIYKGLRKPAGETDRFYLISKGCKVMAHNVVWNLSDDWTGWGKDVAKWESVNGGKQLASFHWDANMNERCLITEYEATDERGGVITTGAEMYDWYQENDSPVNTYKDNLEKLTYNILNYLSK